MSTSMAAKAGAAGTFLGAITATTYVVVSLLTTVSASAETGGKEPFVKTESRMVTTGGTLDFGDRPKRAVPPTVRPPRASAQDTGQTAGQSDWLNSIIDALFDDGTQTPVNRKRIQPPRLAVPAGPAAPKVATTVIEPVLPPLTTGAIDPRPVPDLNADDLDAAIIGDAEISQARNDLIKLELARRTYDEARLSGSSAFDERLDWRVLERGRDAWTETELAAAIAAGFEANTYINDTTRTIVVAIAGTQDLRRDFIEADIWRALIQAQAPQHFFLAKSYIRSVQARYQAAGYHTECVGHSLGGGACAYAGSELGLRAIVLNPISAGKLGDLARNFVTNYVVDGDIAAAIYALRGNELSGDVQKIRHDREAVRQQLRDRYGLLAGPIRIVRDLRNSVKVHQIERALDIIAAHSGTQRVK